MDKTLQRGVRLYHSVEDTQQRLEASGYICSEEIATIVYLAAVTAKPILVEGPAGVGKTELAKAVASSLGWEIIRLQCYEGLDEAKALYEWEYAKQLLYTQMMKDKINQIIEGTTSMSEAADRIARQEDAFFSERFIQPRPLLKAISSEKPVVLLVDEVDKSDPEFEAFLLEILSDFQISIPEIGTRRARHIPFVVLTSNNFRDMSDALKRRCLHLFIDYPVKELESEIVRLKFPQLKETLLNQIIASIQALRKLDLKKKPSIAETLDWANCLMTLQAEDLSLALVAGTLNVILKYRSDVDIAMQKMDRILGVSPH